MPKHDFSALFAEYEAIIAQMPETFDSHQFILRLAQQHQPLYIEALFSYRDKPAPFKIVHGILAKHLHAYPGLGQVGVVSSTDIFGQSNGCARWRRL